VTAGWKQPAVFLGLGAHDRLVAFMDSGLAVAFSNWATASQFFGAGETLDHFMPPCFQFARQFE
jgi:hypothetical protein